MNAATAFELERFVARILRREGYDVAANVRMNGTPFEVDIVASLRDVVTPLEVKYTTRHVGLGLLRQWGSRAAPHRRFAKRS